VWSKKLLDLTISKLKIWRHITTTKPLIQKKKDQPLQRLRTTTKALKIRNRNRFQVGIFEKIDEFRLQFKYQFSSSLNYLIVMKKWSSFLSSKSLIKTIILSKNNCTINNNFFLLDPRDQPTIDESGNLYGQVYKDIIADCLVNISEFNKSLRHYGKIIW
jgi:hypothetical protein